MALTLRRPCRCGHAKDAHEHYRRGSDCSACACAAFHGHLVLTLSVGRQAPSVIVPDEVPEPAGPYIRPAHLAGIPATRPSQVVPPAPPSPRASAEAPRIEAPTSG